MAPDNGLVRAGRRVAYSMAMADGELCRRMNREQGPALQLALPWKVAMRAYEENWKILGLFGGELVQFCLLGYAHLTVDVYAAAELEREIPEEDFLDSERVNGVKGTVWGCIPAGWLLAAMVAGMVVSIRTRIWRLTRENRRGKGWQGWPTMIFRYGQKLLWPGRGLRAAEACWGERLEW
ncbi:MAG: hypothetical protein INH40_20845 [Acidobacteriaceae bacterium]|nr:hypothetical protein [Acidobacteriaceae bacterium]